MPKAYKQLREITTRLEKHYKDVQDFEFTIQDERLFMLQTRSGKRTGYAAVVIATDLVAETADHAEGGRAAGRSRVAQPAAGPGVRPGGVEEDPDGDEGAAGVAGRRERPGGVHGGPRGRMDAGRASRSFSCGARRSPTTSTACSSRRAFSPRPGGMTSHAAVVGRQMGKPSIVGAGELEIDEDGRTVPRRRPDRQGRRLRLVRRPDRRSQDRARRLEAERDPAGARRLA